MIIQGMSIGHMAIALIIIAAICGVVVIVVRQMGVVIPAWFITILWILLAAVIGVFAIRFLLNFVI